MVDTQAMDLTGKVLIAMPEIGDDRFRQSIILVCAHAEDFAMGLILNKPVEGLTLPTLLDQLDIPMTIALPDYQVLDGGPVGRDRGFVLHSSDFSCDSATMDVGTDICLTATRDALHAIASEEPPEHAVLALGYSGWGPGQLEQEIAENAWLVSDMDSDLVFARGHDEKWRRALDGIGITPLHLNSGAGHA
ncbi:MAG: YqgE/AlgH family protein [Pseudomonadota bacterium]